MKPFVKWAGGKRQIIKEIKDKVNDSISDDKDSYRLIEPFVGGGVVFLTLEKENVIINDLNFELMTAYEVIKENPNELLKELDDLYAKFKELGENFYYEIRKMDRDENFHNLSKVKIAARMIFLNKTCYNGLYRVNSEGYFNTPIGRNKMNGLYEKKNILNISKYLNKNNVEIRNESYEKIMELAQIGDIFYLDPPYDYKEDDGFTKYQKAGFSFEEFKNLKKCCDDALDKGAYVIISNNYTKKVVQLFESDKQHDYEVYDISKLATKRSINCKGSLRNNGEEILIWGVPCLFPYTKKIETLFPLIKIKDTSKITNVDSLYNGRYKKMYSKKTIMNMISTLKFLQILDKHNCFTEEGQNLRKLPIKSEKFKIEFAKIIRDNRLFMPFLVEQGFDCNGMLTKDEIASILKQQFHGISNSAAKKRAEIVAIWVRWAKDKLNLEKSAE